MYAVTNALVNWMMNIPAKIPRTTSNSWRREEAKKLIKEKKINECRKKEKNSGTIDFIRDLYRNYQKTKDAFCIKSLRRGLARGKEGGERPESLQIW